VPIAGNDDAIRSVELITKTIADTIEEARREAPARASVEEGEESTYSSDRGMEAAAGDDDRKRRRRPRRRRAKPEAIAAMRKGGAEGEAAEGAEGGAEGGDEGEEATV
jgi:small subunit ribosomal protein S2